MVKEKSVKPDGKKEAPASNEDIEMANAAPELVCYIQTLYDSRFDYWFPSYSHPRK